MEQTVDDITVGPTPAADIGEGVGGEGNGLKTCVTVNHREEVASGPSKGAFSRRGEGREGGEGEKGIKPLLQP